MVVRSTLAKVDDGKPLDVSTAGAFWRQPWLIAGVALLAVTVTVAGAVAMTSSSSRRHSSTTATTTTEADALKVGTTTTAVAASAGPVQTTSPPSPLTTVASTVSGTVTDASGSPVAGAWVFGLVSRTSVQTDATGRYTMPCQSQPMAASGWLLPATTTSGTYVQGGAAGGIPSHPSLGYEFSGGGFDESAAASISCDGQPVDFQLPAGATVTISFVDASGSPYSLNDPAAGPVDNVYPPGVGIDEASSPGSRGLGFFAFDVPPTVNGNQQVLGGLDAGTLHLGGPSNLTCTAPDGSRYDNSSDGTSISVVGGESLALTCMVVAANS
jgi:hypothetical protein